jgi:hypothetical protein
MGASAAVGGLCHELSARSVRQREVDVNQQPGSPSSESGEGSGSGSALGRIAGIAARHPGGVVQLVLLLLLVIIILQNLEPTSIDVLFWSIAAFPKLLLILVSMLVGAAAWEVVRRWIRR